MITPEQIALGAGDDYLLQLNNFFANRGLPAYIRPLGEPNRCLNAWSAVNCDGSQKGGEHTTGWYKQAFRRISAIVRGGQTLEGINATLAEIGLPPLNRTKGPPPDQPAAGAGEHHLEPAAGRLAAGEGQLPRQLLARQPLGRLGRHRLLLGISGLERPATASTPAGVEGQAVRDHRVGRLRRRRTALRQAADRLDRQAPPRADARLLPRLRPAPKTPTTSATTPAPPTPCASRSAAPTSSQSAEYNAGLLPPLPPKTAKKP